jgi:hypothetical protein
MILSYRVDPFSDRSKRERVTVRLTTEHSASSYGQPVIVLPDGGALDLMSWVGCGYRVERAGKAERAMLAKMGLCG